MVASSTSPRRPTPCAGGGAAPGEGGIGIAQHGRQVLDADHAVVGEQPGPLQHIAQLTDVAGPRMRLQPGHGHRIHHQSGLAAVPALQERMHQQGDVRHTQETET